jgi:hypothetical protein
MLVDADRRTHDEWLLPRICAPTDLSRALLFFSFALSGVSNVCKIKVVCSAMNRIRPKAMTHRADLFSANVLRETDC